MVLIFLDFGSDFAELLEFYVRLKKCIKPVENYSVKSQSKLKIFKTFRCAVIATLKSSLLTCNKVLQTIGLKLFLSRIDTVSFFSSRLPTLTKRNGSPTSHCIARLVMASFVSSPFRLWSEILTIHSFRGW